jgi:hypothetical protein
VQAAVESGASDVDVCPGTYGPDEEINISPSNGNVSSTIEIEAVGSGDAVLQSQVGAGDQDQAVSVSKSSSTPITGFELRGLTIEHTLSGSGSASTVVIESGVEGVVIENTSIERGSGLSSTLSAIKPGNQDAVIRNNIIAGGPIGFSGGENGVFTIENNTIRGAGDEGIWNVDADELTIRNNVIEARAGDGESRDGRLGVAAYDVSTKLTLEDNTFNVRRVPFLIGSETNVEVNGTEFTLDDAASMRDILEANAVNGSTPGTVAFVANASGTLRGEEDGKGRNGEVYVVRTGLTDRPGAGGAPVPYSQSALEAAQTGDVIHLTDGATYAESVTLTPEASGQNPAEVNKDLGFEVPGRATIQGLTIDGDYAVDLTGTLEVVKASNVSNPVLVLGNANADATLTGDGALALGANATLDDNGLTAGTITATRTVGAGQTVDFGNIGLTIANRNASLGGGGGGTDPQQTTVTRVDGDPVTKGEGSIERYYDVEAANETGLDVDLTFTYDDAELNGLTESNLVLFRSDDQGANWAELAINSADANANTIRREGLSSFSRFTAAESGSSLPVELTRFDAVADDGQVILRWRTASEANNSGFAVQRATRTDGETGAFQKIGFVDGEGTTTTEQQYRFEDDSWPRGSGTLVYRLKQVDRDGSVSYSKTVEVRPTTPTQPKLIGPRANPVSGTATIRYALPEATTVRLAVYNALGQQVATLVQDQKPAGRQSAQFDTSALPSGVYFVRMQAGAFTSTQRVAVVH